MAFNFPADWNICPPQGSVGMQGKIYSERTQTGGLCHGLARLHCIEPRMARISRIKEWGNPCHPWLKSG